MAFGRIHACTASVIILAKCIFLTLLIPGSGQKVQLPVRQRKNQPFFRKSLITITATLKQRIILLEMVLSNSAQPG
jgi:hypothetical protein